MSLTAIVALLQSALLLLSLAQSGTNLPQTFRDNAASVAQQAISEATLALSSSSSATSSVATSATTTDQDFTLPNGTVVDSLGNIVSAAPTTNTQTNVAVSESNNAPSAPAPITATPTLSISVGQQTLTTAGSTPGSSTSLQMTWDTNIPTTSQIFLTPTGGATQVVSSESGLSTHHVVNVQNLEPNTQYSYMIEAIAGQQDQKISGSFTTPQQLIVSYAGIAFDAITTVDLDTNFPINPQLSELVPTNSSQQSYSLAGTIQTAQENSDGTYSYYWTTNQSLQGIKGNFMVVLTTSNGQTVTSQSFQEPNSFGGIIPGWCIQTATLKASICTPAQ